MVAALLCAAVSITIAERALAQTAEPPAPEAPEPIPEALESPSVLAQFTTGIERREPIDQVTFVEHAASKIYFFTDLRGLDGRTVVHRWLYGGRVMAEVEFEVRGPRWRVWSSKDLQPNWIGDWTVEIVVAPDDEGRDGEVIAAESFTYSAPQA